MDDKEGGGEDKKYGWRRNCRYEGDEDEIKGDEKMF